MNSSLKKRVMIRVYFVYARNIFLTYPDLFMSVIFFVTAFILVSFRSVFNNLLTSLSSGIWNFLVIAIRDTSIILQILMAGFIIRVAVAASKRAFKNIRFGNNFNWLTSKVRY